MRCQPGHLAPLLVQRVNRSEARRHDLANPRQPPLDRRVGHVRQQRLHIAQHRNRVFALVARPHLPIVEDAHQLPQQALVLHNPDIALDVEVPRNPFRQIRQVRRPANRVQLPPPRQFLTHRHGVDAVALRHHLDHRAIDALVRVQREVFRLQLRRRVRDRNPIQQHRTQHRNLDVNRRWQTFGHIQLSNGCHKDVFSALDTHSRNARKSQESRVLTAFPTARPALLTGAGCTPISAEIPSYPSTPQTPAASPPPRRAGSAAARTRAPPPHTRAVLPKLPPS